MLFNALAPRFALDWKAISRGIDTVGSKNMGSVSPYVLKKLKELEIPIETNLRGPAQLEKTDFAEVDLIIALHGAEHRPLLTKYFAEHVGQILYWDVPDLHLLEAEEALSMIEAHVTALVQQLRKQTLHSEPG